MTTYTLIAYKPTFNDPETVNAWSDFVLNRGLSREEAIENAAMLRGKLLDTEWGEPGWEVRIVTDGHDDVSDISSMISEAETRALVKKLEKQAVHDAQEQGYEEQRLRLDEEQERQVYEKLRKKYDEPPNRD